MIFRKQVFGFALVELIIVLVVVALLAAILVPRFVEEQKRSQGSITLNGARQLGIAVDRWALEQEFEAGAAIKLEPLAQYVRPGPMQTALQNGKVPTDAYGNPYVIGTTGPGQVKVNPETKKILEGIVQDWGSY